MNKPATRNRRLRKSLLANRIESFLESDKISKRTFSAKLGLHISSVSRMLHGQIPFSPDVVAAACVSFDNRERTIALVEAYLIDQGCAVAEHFKRKPTWRLERLVNITPVPIEDQKST
jgi:hypothetical protein